MDKIKKTIIGIVIVVITAMVGAFFLCACAKTETGWKCAVLIKPVARFYDQKCANQGGRWLLVGHFNPTYYCDFPFTDADKECSNSSQCKGDCFTDNKYVELNYPNLGTGQSVNCIGPCLGKCSKYHLECEHWFEINDNKIFDQTMFCD